MAWVGGEGVVFYFHPLLFYCCAGVAPHGLDCGRQVGWVGGVFIYFLTGWFIYLFFNF